MFKKCILCGLLAVAASSTQAVLVFNYNSEWRYLKGTAEASTPSTAWRTNGFPDGTWTVANAPFYYGEPLSGTLLNDMNGQYSCVFLRKTFSVANPAQITGMELHSQCDDGFIAWINGVEVARFNMAGGEIPRTGTATNAIEAAVRVHVLPNPSGYLAAGQNVIAIQAFNSLLTSLDFVMDAQLVAAVPDSTAPVISLVSPMAGTVTSLDQITVTFSEPVGDVDVSDLLINGQAANSMIMVNDQTYQFFFPQPAYGTVQISWDAAHNIADFALPPNGFNGMGPGATWQYTLMDTAPPVVISVSPPSNSVVRALTEIEVAFNEPVNNVEAGDLQIGGVAATDLFAVSPSQFLFVFAQPGSGPVTVAFATGHGITDQAGNPFAGGSWSYTLNTNLPSTAFIISEIQAVNDSTLRDEDGEYSDWIEIHNRAEVAGSLNGWFLTDAAGSLTKWRFPNVAIPAGGYLVVFASNKNRTNTAAGRLHTNFQLSSDGEYLALVDANTNIVSEFAPAFPAWQPGEISYGRDRNEPNLVGFFTMPTPGAPNQAGGPGNFAPNVVFSRESGTFVGTFQLSLSLNPPNPGAEIRYVIVSNAVTAARTNVPVATNALYTGPIPVNGTLQVRARAFETGKLPGTPVTASYIQLNPNATNFTSDLPLVLVHNFGASPDFPGDRDLTCIVALFEVDEQSGRSSLTNRPTLITRAGVNRRGSSTEGYAKASLAIEFWDEFNQDIDHEFLGLPEESDWVLYAPNQFDNVLIHNPFAFELSNDVGRYGSRTRMVESFFDSSGGAVNLPNFTSGGDYDGIHVLQEKIKRNQNRVDIERIEQENTTPPSVTGGWLLKVDRVDADERTFSAAGQSIVYQDPDGRDVQLPQWDPQEQYIISYFNAFGNALNGINYTNPITGYAAYIDVDSWIDHHLINVITMNVDAFRLSGYFFKERNGKIEMGPVWDFDRAMGSNARGGDWRAFNPRAWRASNTLGSTDYGTDFFNATTPPPWWQRVFTDPDFFQRYIDTYQNYRTGVFDTNRILTKIDRMADELREAQTREFIRWAGTGNSDTSPRSGVVTTPVNIYGYQYSYTFPNPGTFQGEVDFFKHWMWAHVNFMDTNFLGRPIFGRQGGMITAPVELSMAGPTNIAGTTIYYTLTGDDPRLPGGGISPSALPYTGPIMISTNAYIVARSRNPNHRNLTGTGHPPISSPWSGRGEISFYATIPNLRITEIMYHPADPPPGNTNDTESFEYIEVTNIGGTPLNLNRFRIRGDIDFDFGNLTLGAGQSAVVVANSNAFVSRYSSPITIAGVYTNNLNNAGDRLILEGPLREPIHDFTYSDDWYPSTDGAGFSLVIVNANAALNTWGLAASWRPSAALNGSPGATDPAGPPIAPIVINEVLTHSDPPPPTDTIELYNPTGNAVNIGGWFLTDDFDVPRKFLIPNPTMIQGNGYVTFNEAQFNTGANSFSLSSLGEAVYLFSGNGTNITGYVHGFDFGAAPNGVTFGRHVNSVGSEQFPLQLFPTLGGANSGPRIGPAVVSEIMYHPPEVFRHGTPQDNGLDEFIELQNVTDEAVPLYDVLRPTNTWRLRDAVDFEFPVGAMIPAGARALIVSFDPVDTLKSNGFRQRNAVSGPVAMYGPFRGKLDNSTEAVELERPDVPEPPGPPNFGLVPYILVERIRYTDMAPWPVAADGFGASLQRINPAAFGNDPGNWVAAPPSAGAPYAGGTPPMITQQPADQTIVAFNTAMITVVATGSGLKYQWRFNGEGLPGRTNATLLLPDLHPNQQGYYDVIVLNPAGSVLSSSAFLTVLIPPMIIQQPQHVIMRGSTNEATYGQTFSNAIFSVSVTSSGGATYQWRYNSNAIPGATSATLIINNVDLDDQGFYDVIITDSIGSVRSAPALLRVDVLPYITRHPQSLVALVGDNIALSVEHRGTAPFGYRWRRNGINVHPSPGFTAFRVLSIPNVQTNNGGTYTVIITNAANLTPGVLSANAIVTVLVDSDSDGAADVWETQYGFLPNNGS
ncbi:MAG: lamin tail domain-containing protein, partial [Verrucomicrobia subdivision 3 bacterium]|nr:lamin tail domain-containing protein [Limisphaerales bacterium]